MPFWAGMIRQKILREKSTRACPRWRPLDSKRVEISCGGPLEQCVAGSFAPATQKEGRRRRRGASVEERLPYVPGERVHVRQIRITQNDDIEILAEPHAVEMIKRAVRSHHASWPVDVAVGFTSERGIADPDAKTITVQPRR